VIRARGSLGSAALCAIWLASVAAAAEDPLLRAMKDELQRAKQIKLENLGPPYYVEFSLDDAESVDILASLGGILTSSNTRFRVPDVRVRVGSPEFDNTNYVGTAFPFGGRYNLGAFPIEGSYEFYRRYFWLATDSAYKSALEALARKRAALRNLTVTDKIPDFAPATPVQHLLEPVRAKMDEAAWTEIAKSLSRVFATVEGLRQSDVHIHAYAGTRRFVNSQGTEVRHPESGIGVRMRASAQAADGMHLRDAVALYWLGLDLPPEAELRRTATKVAENLTAMVKAPAAETYTGPVLFEGTAAAQLFAEVLGRNLSIPRRPVNEPGRPGVFPHSELDGRQGARILPEWMNVADDPTQADWRGRRLIGHYDIDREGVPPKPLLLVEKGVLNGFLLTRQPVRNYSGSNGRARMPGNFGADAATISNLFIQSTETRPLAELKREMINICNTRGKPYGFLVRKMDFPSSASMEELRSLASGMAQSGGKPVSIPLLAYRVYPDGREELVRGLRFRGLNARSLKDILAAGDDFTVFDYLENNAPFALMGAPGYSAEASVVAPSVLIDDLEMHPADEEQPKLPAVPPPPK
jgi:predicted Zn-dependent protease